MSPQRRPAALFTLWPMIFRTYCSPSRWSRDPCGSTSDRTSACSWSAGDTGSIRADVVTMIVNKEISFRQKLGLLSSAETAPTTYESEEKALQGFAAGNVEVPRELVIGILFARSRVCTKINIVGFRAETGRRLLC